MRPLCRLFIPGLAMAVIGMAPDAPGQQGAGLYGVTYIEVVPSARANVEQLLRQLRTASRRAPGNLRFEVLERRDRTHHFSIVEAWVDSSAHDANLSSEHFKHFREAVQPTLTGGYDERLHTGLAVGAVSDGSAAGPSAVYAVTHVDFIPPKKDEGIAALRDLAAASKQDSGNLRFEVLQQISRPNHLTLVEIWKDLGALEKHESAVHSIRFRSAALPMSGALYDERLYKSID